MNKLTFALVLCTAPALAQISVTPGEPSAPAPTQQAQPAHPNAGTPPVRRAVAVKSATPAPTATPAPKQKSGGFFGFFRRLFGGGHTEKPAAKPTATPKGKPTATPKPTATSTPKATPAQPKPTATPSPVVSPAPTASPKPITHKFVPSPTPESVPDIAIPKGNSEAAQYQKIKQQALKDASVTTLHEKMLATLTAHPEGGEAYKAAATEYTTALFDKMRKLDPSNAEQISRKEGATKRRIEAGLFIVE